MPERHRPQQPNQSHEQSLHRRRPVRRERSSSKVLPDATQLISQLGDSLNVLCEDLALGQSDRLRDYLAFAARFHHYSRGNQWLIKAQMPTATRVASYAKWKEEGYQVAEGATGIRILAPSKRKIKPEDQKQQNQQKQQKEQLESVQERGEEEDQDTKDTSTTKLVTQVVRFVAVSVFDVSQLTPDKRPPEFFEPVAGDAEEFNERLIQAANQDGFTVEESEYTSGAEGLSHGRMIITRTGLTSMNKALTLIHEYAHGLLHQGVHRLGNDLSARRTSNLRVISPQLKECHAEATAWVVATHFGLPHPFSTDYLLSWGTKPETLRDELDVVLAAASHIITNMEHEEHEEHEEHGEGELQNPGPLAQV